MVKPPILSGLGFHPVLWAAFRVKAAIPALILSVKASSRKVSQGVKALYLSGSPVAELSGSPCVREALLYEKLEKGKVRCGTCERLCVIPPGGLGFCRSRLNVDGILYTLTYGDVSSLSANPIEKKPFFHFWPGSFALTVGSWSCNFTCPWCQNWEISKQPPNPGKCNHLSAEGFLRLARAERCRGTSISFNEPTLMLEYSLEVFRLARSKGYYNTYVSNGYMTLEALRRLVEAGLDGINIDVKGGEEAVCKYCGADVEKVWRNAEEAKRLGVHVEITTLVIPGVNGDRETLKAIAGRILDCLGAETPWHVTQYYPAYKSLEADLYQARTPVELVEEARRIGLREGLKYVYVGNIPGHPGENTYCPRCGELLIERWGFTIAKYRLEDGCCPKCGEAIPITGRYGRL